MELSVILPVYNGETTLPRTLASLRAQSLKEGWEVVAVDDGSHDRSGEILAAAAADFPVPFHHLSFPNAGVGAARNRGLDAAEGTYITYLDADDLLLPHALETALKTAKEQRADLLVFDSEFLREDGSTAPYFAAPCDGGVLSVADYMLSEPAPWNKLMKKSLFEESGLRFPEGIWYEDLALIPALGRRARRIWYHKEILHQYALVGNSITRGDWTKKRLDILAALTFLKNAAPGTEAVALSFRHLYGTFVWQAWEAGDVDAIREMNRWMRETYPHWQKNPVVRRESAKRRLSARLFYGEHFALLRLWKGGKA